MLEFAQRDRPMTFWEKMNCIPFAVVHVACFAAIWTGVETRHLVICFALYFIRMFGVTAGYHRYFAHRTYKLSRLGQFLMAWLAMSSAQKGVLWWAAHHRHHHRFSDTENDIHSPRQHGFWWSHLGWIFAPKWLETQLSLIPDMARYPELRFFNRHYWIPPAVLAGLLFWLEGPGGLVVGFCWSTTLLWHGTFTINSLAHVVGSARYETGDDSKNHLGLALITLGEGWHNNHHHYQASANQGFYWWEIDISYAMLVGMSWVGLVSDLKRPPRHIVENRPHPAWEEAQRKADARLAAEEPAPILGPMPEFPRPALAAGALAVSPMDAVDPPATRPLVLEASASA